MVLHLIISLSDWDPNEHITMKYKDNLVNMFLYQETIACRGRKKDALMKGLNFIGFDKHFRYFATKSIFL